MKLLSVIGAALIALSCGGGYIMLEMHPDYIAMPFMYYMWAPIAIVLLVGIILIRAGSRQKTIHININDFDKDEGDWSPSPPSKKDIDFYDKQFPKGMSN